MKLDNLQVDLIHSLDLLPQGPQFLQGQVAHVAADGGQTFDVVLIGVGFLHQILGDETEGLEDVLHEGAGRNGALHPGGGQVGVFAAIE